jgi:hypothetical protein
MSATFSSIQISRIIKQISVEALYRSASTVIASRWMNFAASRVCSRWSSSCFPPFSHAFAKAIKFPQSRSFLMKNTRTNCFAENTTLHFISPSTYCIQQNNKKDPCHLNSALIAAVFESKSYPLLILPNTTAATTIENGTQKSRVLH